MLVNNIDDCWLIMVNTFPHPLPTVLTPCVLTQAAHMGDLEMSKRALLAGADINRKEGMMLQRPFGVVGQNLEIQKTTDSARFWSSLVLTTNYPFLLIFSALFNFTGVPGCVTTYAVSHLEG